MKNLHYNFAKGAKVFVILRTGERFVAHWMPHDGRKFRFSDHDPIRGKRIRSVSLYKPQR